MSNKLEVILVVLIAILMIAGLFALSGLIFYGLGLLIINTFGIDYTWTYMHGLCVAIIIYILSCIFGK